MTKQMVMQGPPGTGKTTYVGRQVANAINTGKYQPADIMLCSLTKTAASEMSGRIELPKGQIGTLHPFAYRALRESGEQITIAESKIASWNGYANKPAWTMSGGDSVDTEEAPAEQNAMAKDGDKLMARLSLLRSLMIPKKDWTPKISITTFAEKWQKWKEENGLTDFTDLLERSLERATFAPNNPRLIFVDEYQDMSTLENALLKKWSTPADQYITVGDHHQALYEWRGADTSIMQTIDKSQLRTLSQSYRVPAAVHSRAVDWISRMEGYIPVEYRPRRDDPTDENSPSAPGEVTRTGVTLDTANCGWLLDLVQRDLSDGKTVMVLTSCAYMLRPWTSYLRSKGVPFANRYRTKNGSWNPLGKRKGTSMPDRLSSLLSGTDCPGARPDMWTPEDIKHIFDPLEAKGLLKSGGKARLTGIDKDADLMQILNTMNDSLVDPDHILSLTSGDWPPLVAWWFQSLLKSKKPTALYPVKVLTEQNKITALTDPPALTVGTIHSVKGGEADSVYLAPDLSLSGFREWNSKSPGIYRLFYVGMTRAREKLTLLSSRGTSVIF